MSDKVSKKKYWVLKLLQILSAIIPLVILVAVRHERYIYSTASAIRFSIGGVLALLVIVCTTLNILHLKGLGWSIVGVALCWFLKSLIDDMLLIFLCLAVGLFVSKIIGMFVETEKENVAINKSAKKTAEQIEKAVEKVLNNGRV